MCRGCGDVCRVKDYRQHAVAALFGQAMVRLPRLRRTRCGTTEAGVAWPSRVRSTPELDQLRARRAALTSCGTTAEVRAQMFPLDVGIGPKALRRHTFKVVGNLPMPAPAKPAPPGRTTVVTLDATFIRSCREDKRHLEVRIGNVETATSRRQVFGAVTRSDTYPAALIRCSLDAVGRATGTALPAFTDGMRWSQRGANRLLQVRCALYSGTHGTGFGQRFDAANDLLRHMVAAA